MKGQVQKWGNSLALRIPKAFAAEVGLEQNSTVDVSIEDKSLVVRVMENRQFSLAEMLAQVDEVNIHHEQDFGAAVGGEVW